MEKPLVRRVLIALLALLCAAPCGLFRGAARAETARDITARCGFRVSAGNKRLLTDGDITTYWGPWGVGSRVGIILPDDVTAGTLVIEWFKEPGEYTIGEYTADRTLIRERTQADTFVSIVSAWTLDPGTRNILITVRSEGQCISGITVYSQGDLPADVQAWNPPWEKADIMVIPTHQDDEFIYLGGTIPYYAVARDLRVTVVYMADCGRYRRREALRGLWAAGLRNYPEFINLQDRRTGFDESVALWGGKDRVLEVLVARIRRYKPEVIVTHDLNGEYGHNQHKITARAMKYAIQAAADPARYPESAAKYGVWQVKKLYNHLYKENQIRMDWTTELPELGGRSPLKMARIGYAEHVSQQAYFQVENGGVYDNALFGLAFTAVGPDVVGGDMMENIPPAALDPATTLSPEWLPGQPAAPAETPTPAPMEETLIAAPTGTPTSAPLETPTPAPLETATPAPAETALPAGTPSPTPEIRVIVVPVATEAPEATPAVAAEPPRVGLDGESAAKGSGANVGLWAALGAVMLAGAAGFSWFRLAEKPGRGGKKSVARAGKAGTKKR